MKCIAHPESDTRGECIGGFITPLCAECLGEHNKRVAMEMYKGLGITAIVFAVGMSLAVSDALDGRGGSAHVFMWPLLAFTYWGWTFLSDHFPRLTEGPLNARFVYCFVKLVLAYFVGLLVGPWQIFRVVRQLYAAKKENGGSLLKCDPCLIDGLATRAVREPDLALMAIASARRIAHAYGTWGKAHIRQPSISETASPISWRRNARFMSARFFENRHRKRSLRSSERGLGRFGAEWYSLIIP